MTAPAVAWLGVQMLVLALCAARIPLWARFDPPFEGWALHLLAATQVAVSSLLFPWLMHNLRCSLFTITFAIPLLGLATILAQLSGRDFSTASVMLALWLISLALWRLSLRSAAAQLTAVAIASSTTIGGTVFIYVSKEFGVVHLPSTQWLFPLSIMLSANLFLAITIAVFSRQVIHRQPSTSPPADG